MKTKKVASIYSIFIGISMIAMWMVFYVTGNIPELETKPVEIGMHLIAEFITAILLIVGGIGVLSSKKWGLQIYYISMGMLLYTLIMSPAYFFQSGEYGLVVMFVVFIVMAMALSWAMVKNGARTESSENGKTG